MTEKYLFIRSKRKYIISKRKYIKKKKVLLKEQIIVVKSFINHKCVFKVPSVIILMEWLSLLALMSC